jgi:hypothetical protein
VTVTPAGIKIESDKEEKRRELIRRAEALLEEAKQL